jgi:hypothetical protein
MTAIPATGPEPQWKSALARANEVRLRRACVLRSLENEDMTLAEALDDPAIQDLDVFAVVERLSFEQGVRRLRRDDHRRGPRRKPTAARRFLATVPMSPTVRVSSLSPARRQLLITAYECLCAERR